MEAITLQAVFRVLLALGFVAIGVAHFTATNRFMAIMPPWIPFHKACVLISGIAEIAGGVGLLVPDLRQWAAWGLLALLVAVFPANIHMAIHEIQIPGMRPMPVWALWARLPFQAVFMAAVWWVGLAGGAGVGGTP